MQQHSPLYLASQSKIRKHLLTLSDISFIELSHGADETACDWTLPAPTVVTAIARLKMDHTTISTSDLSHSAYVLTVDTLCVDSFGKVHGKPEDEQKAREMIVLWRNGCTVLTGFCLDKKVKQGGAWVTQERVEQTVSSKLTISVPDEWLETYIKKSCSLQAAGGVAIEEFGCQFVQSIEGSYSNILGLPLFELRLALTKLNFFNAY